MSEIWPIKTAAWKSGQQEHRRHNLPQEVDVTLWLTFMCWFPENQGIKENGDIKDDSRMLLTRDDNSASSLSQHDLMPAMETRSRSLETLHKRDHSREHHHHHHHHHHHGHHHRDHYYKHGHKRSSFLTLFGNATFDPMGKKTHRIVISFSPIILDFAAKKCSICSFNWRWSVWIALDVDRVSINVISYANIHNFTCERVSEWVVV